MLRPQECDRLRAEFVPCSTCLRLLGLERLPAMELHSRAEFKFSAALPPGPRGSRILGLRHPLWTPNRSQASFSDIRGAWGEVATSDVRAGPPRTGIGGMMKDTQQGMEIPMQVGSELRIRNDGTIVMDNPELELARDQEAADAVLVYRFDSAAGVHVLRLFAPLADRKHMRTHHPND